ncbi:hypothetical protein P8452_50173 [Trifolium repens]|nr:hypothetical protein P8452_50173 [Trifolium repens]
MSLRSFGPRYHQALLGRKKLKVSAFSLVACFVISFPSFLPSFLPSCGSMFASLVGFRISIRLDCGKLIILAQVKWNQFNLALDYNSIENDLAHLPRMNINLNYFQ